jgi:predicted helicase
VSKLININSFEALVTYLQSDLGWPVSLDEIEDQVFEYESFELGIDDANAVRIDKIMRFRAFDAKQPWSVFYIQFATGALPIVVMRRILSHLVVKRQQRRDQQSWQMHDLLFITNFGESDDRQISFAHFTNSADGKSMPTLKVLGWDGDDTKLRIDDVERRLKSYLTYPDADVTNWPQRWANAFTLRPREVIKTTKELSVALARLARDIRARLMTVLQYETDKGPFTQLMKSFQTALIQDLNPDDFADMYAQTIAYGLLSTRIADPSKQSVDDLAAHLQTNPFLRELLQTFLQMGGRDTHMGIDFDELGINDVIELLNQAQMNEVLHDFNNRNAHEDPVIHFYELFLKEYDAKKRMQRGVFYTPRPVVSYIVRSVHELLQTEFGLADGLAATETWADMQQRLPDLQLPPRSVFIDGPSKERIDPATPFVQVLDPATGTGTFLVEVIDVIYRTLMAKWSDLSPAERTQRWNAYVPQHLLPRLFGYELMMAPYTIAHLKIGLKLVETGYVFAGDQRANIYLTNALEPAQAQLALSGINPALAHEAQAVNTVKLNTRFTVVVGNPPYSIQSGNLSIQSMNLVEAYKFIGNERIIERGALSFQKNLQDDYIKFIRQSQILLSNSVVGISGLITNNSYLDGRSFRGVRWNLLNNSDMICILNLHGSGKKNEVSDILISKDENVFDIIQGVSIVFQINKSLLRSVHDKIWLCDLYGSRETKYTQLNKSHVVDQMLAGEFEMLNPEAPFFVFSYQDASVLQEYLKYTSLTSIFQTYSSGIKTHRDDFVVALSRNQLEKHINDFTNLAIADTSLRDIYGLKDTNIFSLTSRRISSNYLELMESITSCYYRPFDIRPMIYSAKLIELPRKPVMNLMTKIENLAILCCQQQSEVGFSHVLCTRLISECCSVSNKTRETTSVFPLLKENGVINMSSSWINNIQYGTANENTNLYIFYIYSILYSLKYRIRYSSFTMTDFPRIPLPGGPDVFHALATLGEQLVALHLMESPLLDTLITHTVGSNWEVSKVGYADGTVWIDGKGTRDAYVAGTTGFAGVPEEVWNFHIGGYQVCEKWLKDRKGRTLTAEDIAHYQKIVVALHETIRLMAEIDVVIDEHGGWPGAFHLEDVGEAAEPARPQFGQVTASAPKRKAAEAKDQGSFLEE